MSLDSFITNAQVLCPEFEELGQVHRINKVVLVMEGSVSEGKFEVDGGRRTL